MICYRCMIPNKGLINREAILDGAVVRMKYCLKGCSSFFNLYFQESKCFRLLCNVWSLPSQGIEICLSDANNSKYRSLRINVIICSRTSHYRLTRIVPIVSQRERPLVVMFVSR